MMSNKKEKKEIVITGQIVLKVIAMLAIVTVVIFAIVEIAAGTPILEIFTENPLIWIGTLLPAFVIFFLLNSNKKGKDKDKDKES